MQSVTSMFELIRNLMILFLILHIDQNIQYGNLNILVFVFAFHRICYLDQVPILHQWKAYIDCNSHKISTFQNFMKGIYFHLGYELLNEYSW